MHLSSTNETGDTLNLTILIDESQNLMSYSMVMSNATSEGHMSYAVMWGDAISITVDETLPRTAIPVHWDGLSMSGSDDGDGDEEMFLCDSGEEIPEDWVNDGEEDCYDGSDESEDDDNDPPTPEEAMDDVDANDDGYMSYQEFQDSWESENSELDWDEVATLFDDCDYDGNDLIDIDEMQYFIDGVVDMLIEDGDSDGSPEEWMDYIDADDDGYVSLQEFIDHINNDNDQNGEPPMTSEEEDGFTSVFDNVDSDDDGLLDFDEFIALLESFEDDNDGGDSNELPTNYPDATDGSSLSAILDAGELSYCIDPYYPPFDSYNSTTGALEGFDVDLSNALADRLSQHYDVELEFIGVESEWDPIISNLIDGDMCDAIISAMTITDVRESMIDFTRGYYSDGEGYNFAIALREGNNELLTALDVALTDLFNSDEYDEIHNSWDLNASYLNSTWTPDQDNLNWQEEYDVDGDDGEMFLCDSGDEIPEDWVNDGEEDCSDGSDESVTVVVDNNNSVEEPRNLSLTVADNQTFEASLNDFAIQFLLCNSDERSECMVEAEASLYSLTGTIGNSSYVYGDLDMDGMISAGDTLEITDMDPNYEFDLYDSWSDSYVSESAVNGPNMPGFGGLLATISMLGAAFLLPRRDD